MGFHTVMFLDFFGALAAVAGLALAKIPTVIDKTAEDQHVLANLRDGWRALSTSRGLVILIVGVTVGMVAFAPLGAIFPLMTFDHFGGDGYAASLIEAAFGAGMVVGSVVLMAWGGGKRLAGLIAVAAAIVGATTMACGFLSPDMFWAFAALCAVMAMACAWFNGPLITLIQRNVPEEKTGRALGLAMAGMGLASPVGIAHRRHAGREHRRGPVLRGGRRYLPGAGPGRLPSEERARPRPRAGRPAGGAQRAGGGSRGLARRAPAPRTSSSYDRRLDP